jgi:hypothetical protein
MTLQNQSLLLATECDQPVTALPGTVAYSLLHRRHASAFRPTLPIMPTISMTIMRKSNSPLENSA